MLETSLAALNNVSGFDDIDIAMRALGTVNAYVIGRRPEREQRSQERHEQG
jgi:hypothetical protein